MHKKQFEPLHKVMLVINENEEQTFIPKELLKHNNEIFRISRAKRIRTPYTNTARPVYYELIGLESKYGVPWCIHEDWLYDVGVWVE